MFDSLRFVAAMLVSRNAQRKSEEGATGTEYGLLVGLIALIIVFGVGVFGGALDDFFNDLGTTVTNW